VRPRAVMGSNHQHHGAGLQQVDAGEAWMPLFLFSVLFGLSMDYQGFCSAASTSATPRPATPWRGGVRGRLHRQDHHRRQAHHRGGVLRLAAGDLVMFQQMGFGVAVSLLLDATSATVPGGARASTRTRAGRRDGLPASRPGLGRTGAGRGSGSRLDPVVTARSPSRSPPTARSTRKPCRLDGPSLAHPALHLFSRPRGGAGWAILMARPRSAFSEP
jgi:hypothetical protein